MPEREARTVVAGFGQLDLDPTDPAAEFPGQREALGRLARGDGAAGIALDLIFSAEGEVAFDRREPARDARLVGDRVPVIVAVGRMGARGEDRAARRAASEKSRAGEDGVVAGIVRWMTAQ